MERFSAEQRKTLTNFLSNIAVVWFGGGVAGPILAGQDFLQAVRPAIWGTVLAVFFLGSAVWVGKAGTLASGLMFIFIALLARSKKI